jgi:hypothetical protein
MRSMKVWVWAGLKERSVDEDERTCFEASKEGGVSAKAESYLKLCSRSLAE